MLPLPSIFGQRTREKEVMPAINAKKWFAPHWQAINPKLIAAARFCSRHVDFTLGTGVFISILREPISIPLANTVVNLVLLFAGAGQYAFRQDKR